MYVRETLSVIRTRKPGACPVNALLSKELTEVDGPLLYDDFAFATREGLIPETGTAQ